MIILYIIGAYMFLGCLACLFLHCKGVLWPCWQSWLFIGLIWFISIPVYIAFYEKFKKATPNDIIEGFKILKDLDAEEGDELSTAKKREYLKRLMEL